MIATIRSLSRFMVESKRALISGVVLAVFQSAFLIPVAVLVRIAFDDLIPEDNVGGLVLVGLALIGLGIGSSAVSMATRHYVLTTTKAALARLRRELFEKLYLLPSSWFDREETGQIHAVLVQDSERVDVTANALAGKLAPAGIVVVGLSVAMAVISPLLFAVILLTVPLMALIGNRVGPVVRRRFRAWQLAFDRFSIRAQFGLRARSLIRAHSAEEAELKAAQVEVEDLAERGRAMAFTQHAFTQINGAVATGTGAILLVVGGAAVAGGTISLGSLIAFYALVAMLRNQTAILLSAVPEVIAGGAALERLDEFLGVSEPVPYGGTGTRTIAFDGAVDMRDVRFSYREGVEILSGVNLRVDPGERVAVVGPNGAGKTTISALLLGLYEPQHGEIRADAVPYAELDLGDLRSQVAIVPQPPLLFPGTIAENIAFVDPTASREAIERAAEQATAAAFIRTLPDGYETPVGDEGDLLSGGQRQRIAIARAMLRQPALLLLDEPTAGLDRESTLALLAAIRELPRDPAVLLMTHDPDAVAAADRVYELADGRVQERALEPLHATSV